MLTRREFLFGTAALGAGLTFGCKGNPRMAATWKKAICRFCGTGCGVVVGMRGKEVVAVRGDELAHNRGMLCVKGSSLVDLPRAPGRLLYPQIRKGDRFVRASGYTYGRCTRRSSDIERSRGRNPNVESGNPKQARRLQ